MSDTLRSLLKDRINRVNADSLTVKEIRCHPRLFEGNDFFPSNGDDGDGFTAGSTVNGAEVTTRMSRTVVLDKELDGFLILVDNEGGLHETSLEDLIEERDVARSTRDYERADKLRSWIELMAGTRLMDTKDGEIRFRMQS